MKEQSQKYEMLEALRGDRERALERWRADGREPVFRSVPAPPAAPPPAVEEPIAVAPRPSFWRRLFSRHD
jgi:hypothetical protein